MEGKINQDFGAFANKADANRNGTLVINSALRNLQNVPDLDTITKTKKKQKEIMDLMKAVAVNSYKIGRAYLIFCVNARVSLERDPFLSKLNGELV